MTGPPVVVPLLGELEEAEAALLAELEAGVQAAMARLAEAERVAPASREVVAAGQDVLVAQAELKGALRMLVACRENST